MIDFYILEVSQQKARYFTCQFIEKTAAAQKTVYLYMNSKDEAEQMDALLWTYQDDRFLPHQIDTGGDFQPSVLIGYKESSTMSGDCLVNFNQKIPSFYKQFAHIVEIVFSDANVQQCGRERYKQYRDEGNKINIYKLKANEL